MRHRLIAGALVLAAFFFLMPTPLSAQGKKAKGAPPIDSAKLAPGEYVGKVKTTAGADRLFVVTVETVNLVYTGKGLKNYKGNNPAINQLVRLQNQLVQAQNRLAQLLNNPKSKPQQVTQAANKVQQLTAQLQNQALVVQAQLLAKASALTPEGLPPGYKLVKTTRQVEFQHIETVKVRAMFLPEEFDDKGEVKKYTAAEKLKLRGKDKHLPGYESSIDKMEVGQQVKVKLVKRPKRKPAEKEAEDKEAEKDAKATAKEDDGEKKLQVSLIILLKDAQGLSSLGEKGKRKRND
jgi:hypothetical protein